MINSITNILACNKVHNKGGGGECNTEAKGKGSDILLQYTGTLKY